MDPSALRRGLLPLNDLTLQEIFAPAEEWMHDADAHESSRKKMYREQENEHTSARIDQHAERRGDRIHRCLQIDGESGTFSGLPFE